jgi:hypothetical protein
VYDPSLLGLPVQKPFKSEAPLLLEVFNSIFQDLQPEALLAAKQVCLWKIPNNLCNLPAQHVGRCMLLLELTRITSECMLSLPVHQAALRQQHEGDKQQREAQRQAKRAQAAAGKGSRESKVDPSLQCPHAGSTAGVAAASVLTHRAARQPR